MLEDGLLETALLDRRVADSGPVVRVVGRLLRAVALVRQLASTQPIRTLTTPAPSAWHQEAP